MEGQEDRGEPATNGEAAQRSLSAAQLAQQHSVAPRAKDGRTRRAFMARLQQHETLLREAYEHFVRISQEEPVLSYAAEWYLDNYYLLQRVNNQIEEDFSAHYYRELPKLRDAGSPDAATLTTGGAPRVFDIARHLVAWGAGEVHEGRIRRFLDEYQAVSPLRIGELWALPIMLRIVLLEYVIQGTADVASLTGEGSSSELPNEAGGLPSLIPIPGDDLIATCIPSLRALSTLDWKTFVESVSYVDRVLRQDPAQVYEGMDFETRDRYRKAVEALALKADEEEVAVAEAAVGLASDLTGLSAPVRSDARYAHVGYYLVDEGRRRLEEKLDYRPSPVTRIKRALKAHPTFLYIGSICAGVLGVLLLALGALNSVGATLPLTALALLLLLVPALTVVTSIVNWLVTLLVPPRVLPKLDFSEGGIPPEHATAVVIPSMLSDEEEVQSLLRQLEGHYLRNPQPNMCFALLTDFTDAQEADTPADGPLLEAAREGIEALNRAYPQAPFYLFHRRRLWNAREQAWMGWERKRGKLHEFNRLLRGAEDTSFEIQVGDGSRLEGVQYVITLDTDTILPREGAARLVGAMAHPLNRAQFDETGRVVAGYTILQPRTEIQPDWSKQSLFTRVFAGDSGLDLYSQAVSNVYHDLFGEGIYVGKGIYDVDAFERSLAGRVPENSLLSHDLFEGIHGRAGLVSDVIFYEDYPSHYLLQVRRTHRWVRGDWQLLPWLLPFVPAIGGWQRNRLLLIDLWKIGDNLRRSLLSPLLLLLLIAGWTILPGSPVVWTAIAVLTPALALATGVISTLSAAAFGGGNWTALRRQLRDSVVRWMLYIAFLPYEATLNADAILTTLSRLFITRRNLLQWTTASHTSRIFGDEVSVNLAWRNMISSFLVSAILGIALFIVNPEALAVAWPLLLLWSLSPELAALISRPETPAVADVGDDERARLRRLARRTWFFFERFVGPDDNWLPPDHFQEDPKGIVAHRTSPTNIGLYLLSAIAAHDLGYIDPMALMLRLRSAFDAMQHLERYRGHFLNWHDTSTLAPLPPRYVSTVDSGNLAGCLIALQQALAELPEAPAVRWERWQGFLDTLDLFVEALSDGAPAEDVEAYKATLANLAEQLAAARQRPERWPRLLDEAANMWLPQMERRLIRIVEEARGTGEQRNRISPDTLHDWRLFIERAADHIQNMKREQALLAPWLGPLSEPPELFGREDLAPAVRGAWEEVWEVLGEASSEKKS
ncbi:MAG: cellobiose phosphorylase, partial [Chloroflexota bacterium]